MADPCDICGSTATLRPELDVSLVGAFDAQVHRCLECDFRQIRPRLSRDDLEACYASDYFDPEAETGFADYARQQQRQLREAYFLARHLRRLGSRGRLLEVGCALGFLLEGLRQYCDWQVSGLDVSEFAVYFARRRFDLDVQRATLEEAKYPDGSFDFIVQKDLLEHVTHPRQHLQETNRVLRRAGQLWIVTPNGEANLRPLYDLSPTLPKDQLPLLDQAHLSFFTRQNLLTLFADCGFRVRRMRSIGLKTGLRSLGYLPRKGAMLKAAAAGRPGPGEPSVAISAMPDRSADLFDRVESGIRQYHQGHRSWPAYFYFRELSGVLDRLPRAIPLGNDFEFLLEKV